MRNYSAKLWISLLLVLCFCLCLNGCKEASNQPEQTENQAQNQQTPAESAAGTPTENIPQETDSETVRIPSVTESDIVVTETINTDPSEPTEPAESENSTTENTTSADNEEIDPLVLEYINYYNMSGEEQQNFIDSFGSIEAFFTWHTAAKQAYENNRTPIDGSKPIIP